MLSRALCRTVVIGILAIWVFAVTAAWAQDNGAVLSGTIKTVDGAALPGAKVTAKNIATGQTAEAETDAAGQYQFSNLALGDYEISVVAQGLAPKTNKVTLAAGHSLISDFVLSAAAAQPPTNAAAPSLEDLGINPAEAKGTAQEQARLNKRSHMLMLHQRFGLIATAPLIATLFTSVGAGGHSTSTADRWTHLALGSATGDLYFLSAYYAIRAPKIPGTTPRGHIRLHRAMAWIHGPGMIATPILGAIAFDQKSKGEHVHGIAQAHGPVAIVTAAAYGIAIASVSFKF